MEKFHELILPQETIPEIQTSHAVIDGKEADFDIKTYKGKYIAIIFLSGASHSISEHTLSTFSKMSADFDSAGCKLLAITKASVFTVQMWLKTMSGGGSVIPIIADQKEEFVR